MNSHAALIEDGVVAKHVIGTPGRCGAVNAGELHQLTLCLTTVGWTGGDINLKANYRATGRPEVATGSGACPRFGTNDRAAGGKAALSDGRSATAETPLASEQALACDSSFVRSRAAVRFVSASACATAECARS